MGVTSDVRFHENGGVSSFQLLCHFGGVYSFRGIRRRDSLSDVLYRKCAARGTTVTGRLWILVTPFRDTMILPIHTELQMNDIGGAHSKMVSPLILSFLDADGQHTVLHFQCVFLLATLPIPIFDTGPCEQQGWGISLNASSPYVTLPENRCVPHFRDRVTGFHWMSEYLHSLPTIKDHRAVVSKCLEQSNQTGIELEDVPTLNCAKQRTRLEDDESLPTEPFSQYRYDRMMTSQHPLGGGKQCAHVVTAVNTHTKLTDTRRK